MKLSLVFCCLLGLAPIVSQAASTDGFYVDASAGHASSDGWTGSTAIRADLGYRWSWFGIEVGYLDFSEKSTFFLSDGGRFDFKSKQRGPTVGVSGKWEVGSNWYLSSRIGAVFNRGWDCGVESPTGNVFCGNNRNTNGYIGVGAGYDFNQNFSLGATYDVYESSNVFALKAEYRF